MSLVVLAGVSCVLCFASYSVRVHHREACAYHESTCCVVHMYIQRPACASVLCLMFSAYSPPPWLIVFSQHLVLPVSLCPTLSFTRLSARPSDKPLAVSLLLLTQSCKQRHFSYVYCIWFACFVLMCVCRISTTTTVLFVMTLSSGVAARSFANKSKTVVFRCIRQLQRSSPSTVACKIPPLLPVVQFLPSTSVLALLVLSLWYPHIPMPSLVRMLVCFCCSRFHVCFLLCSLASSTHDTPQGMSVVI